MIREHLGDDRVYDVIQDVLKDVSLEDIISSVFNGENSDFSNFVNQDEHTMSEMFRKSIAEQANRIAHSQVDYSHARELKEDSDERRLQPIYIRQFFERAFSYLGGRYSETSPGIFRIDFIPEVLSKYIKQHYNLYVEGLSDLIFFFDKHQFIQYRESNPSFGRAHYINPGNPLFDALVEVVREQFRTDMLRGTVLISPDDKEAFFAFLFGIKSPTIAKTRMARILPTNCSHLFVRMLTAISDKLHLRNSLTCSLQTNSPKRLRHRQLPLRTTCYNGLMSILPNLCSMRQSVKSPKTPLSAKNIFAAPLNKSSLILPPR